MPSEKVIIYSSHLYPPYLKIPPQTNCKLNKGNKKSLFKFPSGLFLSCYFVLRLVLFMSVKGPIQ